MGISQKIYYVEQKMSDTKDYMLNHLICMKGNNRQNKCR